MTDGSPDAGTDQQSKTKPVHVWVVFGAILAICGMIISATGGGGAAPGRQFDLAGFADPGLGGFRFGLGRVPSRWAVSRSQSPHLEPTPRLFSVRHGPRSARGATSLTDRRVGAGAERFTAKLTLRASGFDS